MKYIVRSIKYFFYFALLTSAIVYALVLIGAVEGNIESIFRGGYDALWKMAAFFAAVAAVYPALSFIRRDIPAAGEFSAHKEVIKEYMRGRGYVVENESDDSISFRMKGIAGRLTKLYEDRIVISSGCGAILVDGLRKDVIRIAAGLEARLEAQE